MLESMNRRSFFSLITPVLNAAGTLLDTISSVCGQEFSDCEWIVQDGGSTDGSVELLRDVREVRLVVGADSGLYDAMNRAVARSNGEWLVFLQADDWLEPGALRSFAEVAQSHPAAEILCGGSSAVRWHDGQWQSVWEQNDADGKLLNFSNLALGEPMLNARAYRRDLWERVGGFNTRWSLAADRAWLLQLARLEPACAIVEQAVYRYRWHEGSRTMNEGNGMSMGLLAENLEIAEALQEGCNKEEIRALQRMHTRDSIRLGMNQLEAVRFQELGRTLARGMAMNAVMPLGLVGEIFRCLPGFVARGCKTKTSLQNTGA